MAVLGSCTHASPGRWRATAAGRVAARREQLGGRGGGQLAHCHQLALVLWTGRPWSRTVRTLSPGSVKALEPPGEAMSSLAKLHQLTLAFPPSSLTQTTSSRLKTLRGTTTRRCAPSMPALSPQVSELTPRLLAPRARRSSTTRARAATASRSRGCAHLRCSTWETLAADERSSCSQAQLAKGEEVATCPSCSLLVRVVYDMVRPRSSPSLLGHARVLTLSFARRWTTRTTTTRTRKARTASSRSPSPSSERACALPPLHTSSRTAGQAGGRATSGRHGLSPTRHSKLPAVEPGSARSFKPVRAVPPAFLTVSS